jgi:hypothetical protein
MTITKYSTIDIQAHQLKRRNFRKVLLQPIATFYFIKNLSFSFLFWNNCKITVSFKEICREVPSILPHPSLKCYFTANCSTILELGN